jgi:nicotinate-nucleotide adenylyltransferase
MTPPAPDQGGAWGVLGGTFDPVHEGHLALADQVRLRLPLIRVLMVPSWNHPFKEDTCEADYRHRAAMLKLAVERYEGMEVCEIEAEENLSGYTVDTVKALKRRWPKVDWHFIIGSDNLQELPNWHQTEMILREVKLAVGTRYGHDLSIPAGYPEDRFRMVATQIVDVSSSSLRARLRYGTDDPLVQAVIPQRVLEYIREHKLYQ